MGELQSAERVFLDAFGPAVEPRAVIGFDAWLPKNIVLIDGPMAGKLWSAAGAPYLVEIASCLSEDHPCNRVSIRKSQQSGCTILGMAWALYIADVMPANTLYALPGLEARRDLSNRKLGPLIRAWEAHIGRTVFATQKDRSGDGSTTHEKRFGDSFLGLANANSKMDLSANTVRFGIKDELPKWKRLQTGENPETLFEGRFTAFQRTRDWKWLEFGTPEVDTGDDAGLAEGHCRIDRAFKASDRRFWHVGCPECHPTTGALFYFRPEGLKVDYDHPHRSTYTCPHCGHAVSEAERVDMIPDGTWIPTGAIGNGRHRGYHVDGFMSLMMSLEAMANKAIVGERGTEKDRKDYSTLECGLPYRFKGDAPDYKKLFGRRVAALKRYHVPAGGLLLVAAADVQLRGIWLEILAIGADRQSWTVDNTYLPGDTSSPDNPVFEDLLLHTVDRSFPDAFGRLRTIDALAIDTGYRAHVVYGFARKRQRAHPLTGKRVIVTVKGMPGWGKPAIGQPKPMTVDLDGQKIPQGALLWEVGTWSLKAGIYTDLAKLGVQHDPEVKQDPPGLCHFGEWQDEAYFKQLTAEHLEDVIVRGVVTARVWKPAADNHYLDCRVYNMAMAEYLGLSTMTADEWAELARLRGLPDELTTPDLFTPARRSLPPPDPSGGGGGEAPAGAASSSAAPARATAWDRLAQLDD